MSTRRIRSRALRLSRALALVGVPLLIVGESARRWRQFDEPAMWPSIADDYLIAACLLVGAWAVSRDPRRGRAGLAAAWGVGIGIGYSSVFGHARTLDAPDVSGLPHILIFAIILGMWLTAMFGLALTLIAREPDA